MTETRPELPSGFDWRSFTPDDSPKTPMDVFDDPVARDLATPDLAVGDQAFDFELPVHDFRDGTRVDTGRSFHLAEAAAARPVALVFGSYT